MDQSHERTIDLHAHVLTPACLALVDGLMQPRMDPFSYFGGQETNDYQVGHLRDIKDKLTVPSVRLADMDRMGIDVQAISVAPPQFYYWTDPALGQQLSRLQNENLAEIVEGSPDRFVGLATVPMQDVAAAVVELEYAIGTLGFRGVEINTNIAGLDLDDPRFRPFFAKVAELDVVVLLHPNGFTGGERLSQYYLTNVVGNPLDTTVALTRIIHGGVLEDHPGLKLCFVHGGGYLPFYSSRMDHSWEQRPEGRHRISRAPSTYLKQVYVDGLVFDEVHLGFLIQQMGADHVVLGTDYPFDMGYYDPLGQLDKVANLTDEQRRKIRSETAAMLLKLDV